MTRRPCLALVSIFLLSWGELAAQDAPETAALAASLLRVEYALRDRPPEDRERAELNQAFDRATLAFFAGQVDAVVQAMDALAARIEPDAGVRARQGARADEVILALPGRRRILEGDHPPIPYRLQGPGGGAGPAGYPVIVALHGAGGNEHMFLEAYGAGRLAELADSLGFVVISPFTPALGQAPGGLAGLLDAAEAEFPVDRSRVYLLGHSMGAGVAWNLVRRDPGVAQGVVCLAGPCGGGAPRTGGEGPGGWPPLLVVGGALDPIAPPARLEAAAAEGRASGVGVEVRIQANQGHTLLVGAVLDEVVRWLLEPR